MPNGFFGQLFDTVGMEQEGISLDKENNLPTMINNMKKAYPYTGGQIAITHDASTEFNATYIRTNVGLILVSNHTPEMSSLFSDIKYENKIMGYELVTTPLEIPQLESLIYPLENYLVASGDFLSNRAAIHYHIGFGNNLRILQSLLKICLQIDPVLFRLGGMGRTFRGQINRSAYARPLLNSVAVNVSTRDTEKRYARIINPIQAMDAKTLTEFWAGFGVAYRSGGGSAKYAPCRYSGSNFYSVPQHGTMEFRHFNQSHDAYLIMAIAKFLRGIVELSTVINKRDLSTLEVVESNKEVSMSDALTIVNKIVSLCHGYELENLPDEEEVAVILEAISLSHFVEIPAIPVLTHVKDDSNTISLEIAKMGKLEFFSKVLPPHYLDIHNIKENPSSIYDCEPYPDVPKKNSSESDDGFFVENDTIVNDESFEEESEPEVEDEESSEGDED